MDQKTITTKLAQILMNTEFFIERNCKYYSEKRGVLIYLATLNLTSFKDEVFTTAALQLLVTNMVDLHLKPDAKWADNSIQKKISNLSINLWNDDIKISIPANIYLGMTTVMEH